MTDTAWYDPAGHRASFLILQQPSRAVRAGLRSRFGPPARVYLVDGFTVLTWHGNLLPG
jgi:hypothetical protein